MLVTGSVIIGRRDEGADAGSARKTADEAAGVVQSDLVEGKTSGIEKSSESRRKPPRKESS